MNRAEPSPAKHSEMLPYVQRSPLFSDLDSKQLGRILDKTRTVNLEEGEILFEQQQPAHSFYMVLDGQMKLARNSADGHEKIIDLISPGNTFAEAIMFARQKIYPVTASALTSSRVLCFDIPTYAGILRESTDACFAVLAQMSRRLHWYIGEIDRLTLHGATFRVVCYLLDQVPSTHLGSSTVHLNIPKHAIASRLSITPETLSRSFSKLSRDGLIEVHDDAVMLNDVGKLRQFAHGESLKLSG